MKIAVEINLRADANPVAVQQWIEWGRQLDAGFAAGDLSHTTTRFVPSTGSDQQQQQEPEAEGESVPPGIEPPPGTRKGGRKKSTATAEQQAAALNAAAEQPAQEAAQPVEAPPGATVGFAVPPGMSPTSTPAAASPPPGAEPVAAMPKVTPAPANADGHLTLDDFKAEVFVVQTAAQEARRTNAYPFNVMRLKDAWPDGSPKPWSAMNTDKVPAEDRQKLLDQCIALLNA